MRRSLAASCILHQSRRSGGNQSRLILNNTLLRRHNPQSSSFADRRLCRPMRDQTEPHVTDGPRHAVAAFNAIAAWRACGARTRRPHARTVDAAESACALARLAEFPDRRCARRARALCRGFSGCRTRLDARRPRVWSAPSVAGLALRPRCRSARGSIVRGTSAAPCCGACSRCRSVPSSLRSHRASGRCCWQTARCRS